MAAPSPPFGRLLRYRRKMLGISQEELARRAEVSPRHVSFVETGKSVPSREMVVAIVYALGLEDEGLFLEAAGYLAPYPDVDLTEPEHADLARQLREVVDRQPVPALLHDRFGTLLHVNRSLRGLVAGFTDAPVTATQASGHTLLAELSQHVRNWDRIVELCHLFRELVRGGGELGLRNFRMVQLLPRDEATRRALS